MSVAVIHPAVSRGSHQKYQRDYDPAVGRYVESDPLGLRDDPNTYGYVRQNPLSRIDPSGFYRRS